MARRRRRSFGRVRRFGRRFHRMHKQGLFSKITSAIALGIGASPAIGVVVDVVQHGKTLEQAQKDFMWLYTGIGDDGRFNIQGPIRGYAPIIAAIFFKKGIGYLGKIAKLKL